MAADEAEATLYLLCEACTYHGSAFSQRPQQIEVVVFRKRFRRASTLLLSSFEAGPGPCRTRHQILLSLDLETDKLTYHVVTSNFELDLLRASDTLLVFGVSAQDEAAMQALRSASRSVHPERGAAGAESGRSARLPAVLIVPNLSRQLSRRVVAKFLKSGNPIGEPSPAEAANSKSTDSSKWTRARLPRSASTSASTRSQ